MKPDKDARQALEALLRDGEGMSDAEVNAAISRELDKGERMDADLVVAALGEEPEGPETDAARKVANWEAIERKLDEQARAKACAVKRRTQWMRAVAVIAAVFVLVSAGTVATNAWRWDFLVQIFRPMIDTMGIHLNVEDLGSAGKRELAVSTASPDGESESATQTIRDESQVPKNVRGYDAFPNWLPEGYTFNYATVYNDYNESSLLLAYRKGEGELFVQTFVYSDDATTAVNVMEMEIQKDDQQPRKIEITENEGVVNATCEDNLACYTVWGRLSREDISHVITSIR